MSRVLGLAMLGGAAIYAQHAGLIDWPKLLGELTSAGRQSADLTNDAARDPRPSPASAFSGEDGDTLERRILRENWQYVSGWSQQNLAFTEAIMHVESRGKATLGPVINNGGIHQGDRAQGIMQVMPKTGEYIAAQGYRRLSSDRGTLRTTAGSVYFGTAYLEILARNGKGLRWMAHAYNGGPGWPALTPGSANYRQNQDYALKVMARFEQLTQGDLV